MKTHLEEICFQQEGATSYFENDAKISGSNNLQKHGCQLITKTIRFDTVGHFLLKSQVYKIKPQSMTEMKD